MSMAMFDAREALAPGGVFDRSRMSNGGNSLECFLYWFHIGNLHLITVSQMLDISKSIRGKCMIIIKMYIYLYIYISSWSSRAVIYYKHCAFLE